MKLNVHYLSRNFLGVIGAIIVIISEFLPWFWPGSLLLAEYIRRVSIAIEDAFLYLFPIISGGVCFVAKGLFIYDKKYKMKSIIINIVGLSFLLIFLFELIPSHFPNIFINIGIYICLVGLSLIIIDLIKLLSTS